MTVRVLVVGGLRRLDAFYRDVPTDLVGEDGKASLDVASANVDCPSLDARAGTADAIVLVLGHLSHSVAARIRGIARRRGIPIFSSAGSSVSRVRGSVAAAWVELRGREKTRASRLVSSGAGAARASMPGRRPPSRASPRVRACSCTRRPRHRSFPEREDEESSR